MNNSWSMLGNPPDWCYKFNMKNKILNAYFLVLGKKSLLILRHYTITTWYNCPSFLTKNKKTNVGPNQNRQGSILRLLKYDILMAKKGVQMLILQVLKTCSNARSKNSTKGEIYSNNLLSKVKPRMILFSDINSFMNKCCFLVG